MRNFFLSLLFLFVCISCFGQSTKGEIAFKKKSATALILELPNNAEDIEGTIVAKLKENGFKPQTEGNLFWKKNTQDGFYVFKGIMLSSLGSQPLDLYFKVIKNKVNADTSGLALLVSTGNENFIDPYSDAELWTKAEVFLDGFVSHSSSYRFDREITTQNKKIKSLQSRLSFLQKDQKDLEQRILKYQRELEQNKLRQAETESELQIQANMLERTRAKNKPELPE